MVYVFGIILMMFPLFDFAIASMAVSLFCALNIVKNGIEFNRVSEFSFFYWYLIIFSLFFSPFSEVFTRLESSLFLGIVPIVLASTTFSKQAFTSIFFVYVGVILIESMLVLSLLGSKNDVFEGGLIPLINVDFHGTYFSYQVFVAILICYYLITDRFKWLLIIFFSIIILVFQKKIAVIVLLLWGSVRLFKLIKGKLFWLIPIAFIGLFSIKGSFKKISTAIDHYSNNELTGTDQVRLKLLNGAFEGFLEHPLFGRGVVEHSISFAKYNVHHLGVWAESYNTHNYFFFVLLSGGIVALFFFLLPFIRTIIDCKLSNKLLVDFLVITLIFNLTESIFDRFYGVITFSIFLSLFNKFQVEKKTDLEEFKC